jgi:hypothetical protein
LILTNYLADVNVWIALASVGHVHHAVARGWFEERETARIGFCRVTQAGFLRLLNNERMMGPNVLAASEAWRVYDAFYTDSRIRFLAEPASIESYWRSVTRHHRAAPNFWTDAYLSAFATAAGLTLVTFDRGFPRTGAAEIRLLRT